MTQLTIPKHLAFILDGNRRWAQIRGKPTFFGHKKGIESVKNILIHAQKLGIKIITVYGFSTENWNRSEKEVNYLMNLFESFINRHIQNFHKRGISLRHLGAIERLPQTLQKKIKQAIALTKNNEELIFNIALNYGGRDEVVRTVKKIIKKGHKEKDITMELINKNLDTGGLPDPDMIIRTSGEKRLSGFLPWQGTYSELYFPAIHWPDFDEKALDETIKEYNKRQRRFGK